MRRFFAQNLLFVLFLNLLVKPAWIFLIDLNVQNKVGHEAYGTYQPLLNLAVIFQIVLDFGLNSYNSRILSHHPGKVKQLFPVMLSARLLLSIVYLILVGGIGLLLGYSGQELLLLQSLLAIQILTSIIALFRSTTGGLHRFKWDGILSVTDRLLMIFICGVLLLAPSISRHFTIQLYVAALTASSILAVIIGFFITRHTAGISLKLSFHKARVWNIIRKSFPYALLILLMGIYTRVDFILIERILGGPVGKEHAGVYAAAYRLLDMGNMLGLMFANMLLPLFGRMLKAKQDIGIITRLCTNVLIPLSLIASAVGLLYPHQIMDMLYVDTSNEGDRVFTMLMFTLPAFSLSNVYSTLLTSAGRVKMLVSIAAIGVAVNLILNFWLIPREYALGAAWAALATQWLVSILFVIGAQQIGRLQIRPLWILSFPLYFLLLGGIGYGLMHTGLNWMIQASLLLAIACLLMFLFRYIRVKELMALAAR